MKRKIDSDSQGAENQREESRLEIDRHRMPRQQIDAYEQVERPPEEIHDGGGRTFAAGIGKRRRKGLAAQSAGQMRDARAFLHLSYSCASPCGPAILVTQDPIRKSRLLANWRSYVA